MLMIYLMAVWTLDLFPYTAEDAINTTQRLPSKSSRNYGTANQYRTSGRRFNSIILSSSTTTLSPIGDDNVTLNLIASSTTSSSNSSKVKHGKSTAVVPAPNFKPKKIRAKKKDVTKKLKPKHWIRANNTKFITRSERDLLPKSNMQVLQFYAQPLNAVELKGQVLPTLVNSGLDDTVHELPVLVNPAHSPAAISHSQVYMAPSTYANSVSYKTVPEEYIPPFKQVTYNIGPERPALTPMPVLDPYNVYKRNPKPKTLPLMSVPPAQKFVATIRSVTPSVPIRPPVSVTQVYKYTEDGSPVFKLPFLENDDPIDENLPILSAALDDRLNDRVASLSIRNYMTPSKLAQPIVYGSGTRVAASLPDAYRNEYQILSKFNENLRTQPSGRPKPFEEETSGREKENYSEEEVKKALKYIQRLKKNKPPPNRGRATFKNSQQFRNIKRKPGGKSEDENLEDDVEEEDIELEQISASKKKRKKEHDPFHISDDDDEENDDAFQIKSFTEDADKNQEESRTKTVKTNAESTTRSIEIHEAAPSVVNNKIDENEPLENPKLGVDNDGDDRVEFQMHGLGGAESYKFGYDTGKGENRQFRYEERDAYGKVKGHFGYYDRDGKLQLFNYEADPEHGYHLEKAAEH